MSPTPPIGVPLTSSLGSGWRGNPPPPHYLHQMIHPRAERLRRYKAAALWALYIAISASLSLIIPRA